MINDNDSFFDQLRERQSPDMPNAPAQPLVDSKDKLSAEEPTGAEDAASQNNDARLPAQAKRALVSLLRYGVILFAQKPKLFDSIIRYQDAVRNHLADVYLKLVLDEKAGVAFVSSMSEEDQTDDADDDDDIVPLITRRTLTLYDTLLLLVLRKHYQERETSGEQKVVIDLERMEANLTPFLPLTNNSKTDRQKLVGSLKKMIDKKIISLVRGSRDRFEITPVIRYVVNAEFLETMLDEYHRLAKEASVTLEAKPSPVTELFERAEQ